MDSITNATSASLSGFGNEFASEALPGALPTGRNSPQRPPLGLYAEQLSCTPFTAPRREGRRSWLYRIRPSAEHPPYLRVAEQGHICGPLAPPNPNRLRWNPWPIPTEPTDFLAGLATVTATGTGLTDHGVSVHIYAANTSMHRVFFDADGELLILPQQGRVEIATEMGQLTASPGHVVLIPRGIRFRVALPDGPSRGYVCENHGAVFRLPDLGPIGANGLANPRDFLAPRAAYEDVDQPTEVVQKYCGELWATTLSHSPLDVVAWHGNLTPVAYDLARFNAIGSISFDHPDPSIFTVLTAPTDTPGRANADFVIFPPRWMVAEDTFRPPWFHRNIMNECMGLIDGQYDAKAEGFLPGGMSLHAMMSAHGPDAATTDRAMKAPLNPHRIDGSLAFMFETSSTLRPTAFAMACSAMQERYDSCWDGMTKFFRP